jgi:hypothetical protein
MSHASTSTASSRARTEVVTALCER